jgi:ferrous iron transport protein A
MASGERPDAPTATAPLGRAPFGEPLVVGTVSAPPQVRRRLAELGLRAGSRVVVMRRTSGGGAILGLGDARVAVSRKVLGMIEAMPGRPGTTGRRRLP